LSWRILFTDDLWFAIFLLKIFFVVIKAYGSCIFRLPWADSFNA